MVGIFAVAAEEAVEVVSEADDAAAVDVVECELESWVELFVLADG